MENKMETTIVYWGYNMGIMENKMKTTVVYLTTRMYSPCFIFPESPI